LRAPDAIVLDLQLPDIDGLEICRRIRQAGDTTPILMLTARDAVVDGVAGLDVGADDYLVKPFDLAELLARLRALLRRHNVGDGDGAVLRFEDLTLNPQTREVHRGARGVELTKIEFDLLELFLQHPRQVLTRDQILDLVWGYNFDSGTNSLAVYIGYLRRKLEEASEARLIQTVRGVGYALRNP
jgi:two-component system response regulator MprA